MDTRATIDAAAVKRQIEDLRATFPGAFDDEEFLSDLLEGETGLFEVMQRLDDQLADAEMMAGAIKDRRSELADRQDRMECKADAVRQLMQALLDAAGLKRLVLPTGTISVRNGTPRVVVIDETEIPDQYLRTTTTVDKSGLAAALRAGADIPGAMLSNGAASLSVRRS
jgi:hypothetical protein